MTDDPDQAQQPAQPEPVQPEPEPDRDPVEDLAEVPWTDWRAVAAVLEPYPLEGLWPVELTPGRLAGDPPGEAGDEDSAGGTAEDEEDGGVPAGGDGGG